MAQLCLYLPPFSPDYSGAGALLFDLKSLTVMHDAGGCTGNYTGHDEPRWYGSNATVFCSALRMIDAIMGNDEKLKNNVIAALDDLQPELITLIGSPVPMVIGMDFKGLAVEIEAETQIPAIGIETTGTEYYNIGEFKAAKTLLEKFVPPLPPKSGARDAKTLSCNILGATPLDYECVEDIDALERDLAAHEITTILRFGYGYTLQDLKRAASADINIAVSHAGYLIAKYMEETYGIPYLCGFPFGPEAPQALIAQLRSVCQTGRSAQFDFTPSVDAYSRFAGKNILVLGDQVIASSLRTALGAPASVTVGCLFGLDESLAMPGDLMLRDEDAIMRAVNEERFDVIIGDPLLRTLLSSSNTGRIFCSNPQFAISGDLHKRDARPLYGEHFQTWMQATATS
ncbi:MAG: nitrogenase component 1 [Lachnospiraceae bacterium]|nr:nitrogenase component 1 [Lachnospiraceae bacterium]